METTKTPSVRAEQIDPSIENTKSEECTLSILLNEGGLVFSILRNDFKKFIVLGDYQLNPTQADQRSLFNFKQQLKGDFANYAIGFQTPKFTLIPQALFNAEELGAYANFQFERTSNETLLFDEVPAHALVIVYAMPNPIKRLLDSIFPGVLFKHAAFFSITYYLAFYKNQPGQHIHLNVWGAAAEIVVVNNGKLQLCTQFAFKSNEDLLYFVLNVFEQLALNPENTPLKVSGEIDKNTPAWQLLEKYIRFVELEKRPPAYHYSHEFKSLSAHMYNRIFQASTCV